MSFLSGEDEDGPIVDDGMTIEACPDCGAMKRWHEGKGGSRFLGCSKYPKCRWTSYRGKKMDYRKEVLGNCPSFETDTIEKKLSLGGLGVAGEGAEVLDVMMLAAGVSAKSGTVADTIKKVLHHDVPVERVKDKLVKEMGDVYWYLEYLGAALGMTREQIMQANVDKLRVRHPNGWSAASQQAKADEPCPK